MQLRFGDFLLDSGTRELLRDGDAIALSPKAFQLLELLAAHRPNAVSKEEIHRGLWPDTFVADGNLPNLISELRGALGDDAQHPSIIRTVHRFGYAFRAGLDAGARLDSDGPPPWICRLTWSDREIVLEPGVNVIGRDQDATVFVDDVSVSRHHARIVVEPTVARLEDLGSKNGTYLGGKRLRSSSPLRDGDEIRLGSIALVFRRYQGAKSTETLAGHRP